MKTSGPDGEARVLARIEAELRKSDPQLPALFDKLDEAGRDRRPYPRPEGTQWTRLLAALLPVFALVLMAVLAGGHGARGQGCPALAGCPGIAAFADRAAATVQAHIADVGREISAQLCQSIPVRKTAGACG
jgi:hypothetical protein